MEYCAQHAREGMVDVKSKKCRTASCGKVPYFGVAGTKTGEYCAQHALEGMVDIKSKKCRIEGCGKIPCFGVAGTKNVEHCAQHAPEGMVYVKSKKCRTASCGKVPYSLTSLRFRVVPHTKEHTSIYYHPPEKKKGEERRRKEKGVPDRGNTKQPFGETLLRKEQNASRGST